MNVEDKQIGQRVGYTVLVIIAVMVGLIIAANIIG